MRRFLGTLAIAAATAGLVATPVEARSRMTGEEQLAKLIDGRTAGAPRLSVESARRVGARVVESWAPLRDEI